VNEKRPELTEEEVAQKILATQERVDARNNLPYDGIMGSLPEWAPGPIQEQFEIARNRVIDSWQYTREQALEWLDRFTDTDLEWEYPAKYPNGLDIDPRFIASTFGFLAQLRWAANLPVESAMYILAGEYSVRGYRNAKNLKKSKSNPTTLSSLVAHTFSSLTELRGEYPSSDEVLDALETYDRPGNPVVERVNKEWDEIVWCDLRDRPKTITIQHFRNLVTDAKKEFSRSRENMNP
jgi:hypothetical protein